MTISRKPRSKRSPKWPALAKRFLRGKACAVCGSSEHVVPHHIVPVHVDPSQELVEANLLPLCENRVMNCHCVVGHLRDWKSYNPTVREDAELIRQRIANRPGRVA